MKRIFLFIFLLLFFSFVYAQDGSYCADSNYLLKEVDRCYRDFSENSKMHYGCPDLYYEFITEFFPKCYDKIEDLNLFNSPQFQDSNVLLLFCQTAEETFVERMENAFELGESHNFNYAFDFEAKRFNLNYYCFDIVTNTGRIITNPEYSQNFENISTDYLQKLEIAESKLKEKQDKLGLAEIGARYTQIIDGELIDFRVSLEKAKEAFFYAKSCGDDYNLSSEDRADCYYYAYEILKKFPANVINEHRVGSFEHYKQQADYYIAIANFLDEHVDSFSRADLLPEIADETAKAATKTAENSGCLFEGYSLQNCKTSKEYFLASFYFFEISDNKEKHTENLSNYFDVLVKLQSKQQIEHVVNFFFGIIPSVILSFNWFPLVSLFFLFLFVAFIFSGVSFFLYEKYLEFRSDKEPVLEDVRKPNFFIIAVITLWVGVSLGFTLHSDFGQTMIEISQIEDLGVRNEIINSGHLDDLSRSLTVFIVVWVFATILLVIAGITWIFCFFNFLKEAILVIQLFSLIIFLPLLISLVTIYWDENLSNLILGPIFLIFFAFSSFALCVHIISNFKKEFYLTKSSNVVHKEKCRFIPKKNSFEKIPFAHILDKDLKKCNSCFKDKK